VERVRAYLRDGESPPHRGQYAVNVVRSERIGIFGAVEVSDPEARYDLVHMVMFFVHG
jgi:hypothetical protein